MSARLKFWLISAAALSAVLVTLSLGRWQLSRAAQKEQLQASIEEKGRLVVLEGATLLGRIEPGQLVHRRISVRGRWIADRSVFLDNRQMNSKPGFYVVTPLQLEGGRAAVLVQRGWVPRNFVDRTRVPRIETPGGVVEVQGRIAPPPSKLYEPGVAGGGPIRQNLDLAQYSTETGLVLIPVSVQQTGAATDGLLRDWPEVSTGVEKNYGYAFQWFGLSALIAILYVWFQIVRRFIKRRSA